MFFKDDDGAQGVLFGEGKIVVANFEMIGAGITYAGVLLGEVKEEESSIIKLQGKNSEEINTKIRLVFQETKSIDLLIESLKKAKRVIADEEITRIIKPGGN